MRCLHNGYHGVVFIDDHTIIGPRNGASQRKEIETDVHIHRISLAQGDLL